MSHPKAAPWRPTDLWPREVELKRPGRCDFCWAHYFTAPLSKARQPLENGNRVPFGSINRSGCWWDPEFSSACPHIYFQQVSPVTAPWHIPTPPLQPPTPMFVGPGFLCDWPTSDILGIPINAGYGPFSAPSP